MAYQNLSTFFLLLSFLTLPLAAAKNGFTYPPRAGDTGEYISDLVFTVGQEISLKWTLEYDSTVDFWLLQDTAGDGNGCPLSYSRLCGRIAQNIPNNGSLPWVVNRMDMLLSDIYYIAAVYDTNYGFTAHYFNITDSSSLNTTSTTSSAPSVTSSSAPSATSSSAPSATSSSAPSETSSSSASDGSTAATKSSDSRSSSSTPVGAIAGGVVGGVVGLSIIAVLAFMLYKKQKKTRSPGSPNHGQVDGPAPKYQYPAEIEMPGVYVLKPEIDGASRPHELPS